MPSGQSDRSYAVPPTTSSHSLASIAAASSPPNPPQAVHTASLGGGLLEHFTFTSLAGVWTGLTRAVGNEVGGFWRGVGTQNGANAPGHERDEEHGGRERKRRRTGRGAPDGEVLFDSVPSPIPPISQTSPLPPLDPSSSPAQSRRSSSLSPEMTRQKRRRDLRPYALRRGHSATYDDVLMRGIEDGEDILPPLPSSSSSKSASSTATGKHLTSPDQAGLRSLSGRRKLSLDGAPKGTAASSTPALSGRPYAKVGKGGNEGERKEAGHGRTQSLSHGGPASRDVGVPLPAARHVHFAPMPGSSSLPNLASLAPTQEASSYGRSPHTLARSTSHASTSPASAHKRRTRSPPVSPVLFGDSNLDSAVAEVWRQAREEEREKREEEKRTKERVEQEKRERREKRIRELEEEVGRLKGELSKPPRPAATLPPKSPRQTRPSASHPPPPPAPPPPPIGRPHPLLQSIRASLKATPPRASSSNASKLRRRASTLGGPGGEGVDMGAFLKELGGGRGRLRKVGLPEIGRERKRIEVEGGGGGELEGVLQRAFARKFAGTASPSTPRFPSSRSTINLRETTPEWTSPRRSTTSTSAGLSLSLAQSQSQPVGLSSLSARSHTPPLPPQPVFVPSLADSSSSVSVSAPPHPPPRTSSLYASSSIQTETTVFGQALSTDTPAAALPAPITASVSVFTSTSTTSIPLTTSTSNDSIDSLSHLNLPSAPPETPPPPTPRPTASSSTAPTAQISEQTGSSTGANASARLDEARKRSGDGSPLPGLKSGKGRGTPASARRKMQLSGMRGRAETERSGGERERERERGKKVEEEEDQVVLVLMPEEASGVVLKGGTKRTTPTAINSDDQEKEKGGNEKKKKKVRTDQDEDFGEEAVLKGHGMKEVERGRVFGRA
ncbi:hypothetical protein JCM11641_005244 [Rhodosporidiobolus odoratus]